MFRRVTVLALAVALLTTAAGCRSRCGGGGWFTSRLHDDSPCRLVGRPADACCDPVVGMPVSVTGPGVPGGVIPGTGVPLVPSVGPAGTELPYPQPTDLIPRPGVPVPSAVPTPAPGGETGLLPQPRVGVPVTNGK